MADHGEIGRELACPRRHKSLIYQVTHNAYLCKECHHQGHDRIRFDRDELIDTSAKVRERKRRRREELGIDSES